MNLIGHMVCAEHFGPEARLGAMLPDLLSLYDRRLRPHSLIRGRGHEPGSADEGNGPGQGADEGPFAVGLRFHFHVDSAFHRSDLFHNSVAVIREGLSGASGTPGLKRFAAAHILSELFLDHLLVVNAPARLQAFYDALGLGLGNGLREYLGRLDGMDGPGFGAFLRRLRDLRFADGYLDRDNLLDRTERILSRLRQRPFEPAERRAVLDGLGAQAASIGRALDEFILAMQGWKSSGCDPLPAVDSRGQAGIE